MRKDYYILLIYKDLKEEILPTESTELKAWLSASKDNRLLANELRATWERNRGNDRDLAVNLDTEFLRLQRQKDFEKVNMKPEANRSWLRVAAALALIVVAGIAVLRQLQVEEPVWYTIQADDGIEQIVLPDQSTVWLNKGATLDYPEFFTQPERNIRLSGEAFFQVSPNQNRQFLIETSQANVRVLGTSFNVNSQADITSVTVESGKVSFESKDMGQSVLLEKQEKATLFHQTGSINKESSPGLNEMAWKSRKLVYKGQSLESIIEDLNQYYGVSIKVGETDLLSCELNGYYHLDSTVDEILSNLSELIQADIAPTLNNLEFIIEGGTCPN